MQGPDDLQVSIGYIPVQRDIGPVISCEKGQCLSEAKEEPRAKPKAFSEA